MIETQWELSTYNSSTTQFENPQSILAPHATFDIVLKATRHIESTVDGGQVWVKPEKNHTKAPITFTWKWVKKEELKHVIQSLIQTDTSVQLNMNPTGSAYDGTFYDDPIIQGYFLDSQAQPILGIEGNTQFYDLKATFQPFGVIP